MEHMYAFFAGLPRQGPGTEESTLRALAMVPDLPEMPRVLDLGCGTGASTLVLARATGGHVTALDNARPFLDVLEGRIAEECLRVTLVEGDMGDPPFPEASFDLIWSEGAIYNVGFEAGLTRWRRLLRPRCAVAVTEAVWLDSDPPDAARAFWDREYPDLSDLPTLRRSVAAAGLHLLGDFVLPRQAWADYYAPIRTALHQAPPELGEGFAEEIATFERYGDCTGYAFFVAVRP